jgi:hypothetical protein
VALFVAAAWLRGLRYPGFGPLGESRRQESQHCGDGQNYGYQLAHVILRAVDNPAHPARQAQGGFIPSADHEIAVTHFTLPDWQAAVNLSS